ncbi:bactericidal permeability-increasing protein-like [Pecten maximus]|uniref:bactericidal permeability-increasing protein-like n=1 Tax=Pecten maximus TaxID=6579 RepID=UPI0014583486|nr:bactericidal permeability-increasing protein-like [Pecten maximus]
MASISAISVFLLLVNYRLSTALVSPGFKTRITSEGLTYANSVALDVLSKAIIGVSVPDQSGTASIVTYHLTGIHITEFNKPASQVTLNPNGVYWTGNNAVIQMHGNWRYNTLFISDSGNFDVSATGVSFHENVALSKDTNGRPHIKASGCGVSIGSVSLTFHGGASWLYNLFSSIVANDIKSALVGQVCGAVTDLINTNGENALSKLPVTVDIVNTFLLDYSMDEQPMFQKNFMESYHKGEIDWKSSPAPPPFTAPPLPPRNDTSRMMYVWVSDFMLNSMLYQGQLHKFFAYNLTAQDLPLANRSALNTTCHTLLCIGNLIPQLQKSYPNCQVDLHMRSASVPSVAATPTDVLGSASGIIDFYARPVTGNNRGNRLFRYSIRNTPAYLFTLNVTMSTAADVQVKNETIYGKLRDVKFGVKVVKTTIKDINDKALQFIIDIALNTVVIPKINSIGAKGLALPTIENVHFVNPSLSLMQRTVLISTDLHYAP